jgi:hypothetical protein
MCFMYFCWVEGQHFSLSGQIQKARNSCLMTLKPVFCWDVLKLYGFNLRFLLNLTIRSNTYTQVKAR